MFSTMTCVRNMPPSNSLQTRCVRWGSRNSGGTGVAACFYPLRFKHTGPPTAPPELAEPHSNTETWLSPRPAAGGATPDARRKETPDNGRRFTNKQAPAERFLTRQIRPPCRHSSGRLVRTPDGRLRHGPGGSLAGDGLSLHPGCTRPARRAVPWRRQATAWRRCSGDTRPGAGLHPPGVIAARVQRHGQGRDGRPRPGTLGRGTAGHGPPEGEGAPAFGTSGWRVPHCSGGPGPAAWPCPGALPPPPTESESTLDKTRRDVYTPHGGDWCRSGPEWPGCV